MSTDVLTTGRLAALAPLRAWWQALPGRERRLLLIAAAVIGLYLVWLIAVQPAWRTLDRTPLELDALEQQTQVMRRLAAEATELRAAPPVNREQAEAALHAATDRLGDQGRLTLQGDRAVLSVTGIGTAALRDWLAEVRSGARARPVEATLTRAAKGYNGSVVVAIGGGA